RRPLAPDGLTDVDDHIELGRAVVHRLPGLEDLDRSGVAAVRKADRRADRDSRTREQARGERHGIRLDAYAGHTVLRRKLAARFELVIGQSRPQERMVDALGDQVVVQYQSHGMDAPMNRISARRSITT